ncbi:SCO family protein [Pseudofulvibacter geojedonensis]|uniref:SCO family protein n=1 Tax=Pseudofulvibacter geojedonensis TaxID=1123758 RepID=A0ABW3I3Y9_9FLAO
MKPFFLFICILFLISCKKENGDVLPVLSYHIINGEKKNYKIDNFSFVNQYGKIVTPKNTLGKVHTFNFFFTSCPSICPPMKLKQLNLAEEFKNYKDFQQFSITIDLKRDSIEKLQYYSEISGINHQQWNLLRAKNETDLQKMAQLLKTNFKPNEDGTDFYHSSYLALLDKQQQIRGFYDILSDSELSLLKKDITILLSEE